MSLTIAVGFVKVAAPLGGLLILALTVPRLLGSRPLSSGFRVPAIALELVQNEDEVKEIKGRYRPETIRRDLKLDLCVFIPLYVVLFIALSYWLVWRDFPYAYFLGTMLAVCVVGAALFDVVENLQTFSALRRLDQSNVDRIRGAALVKWSLFFIIMGLLAVPFAWQGGWASVVAALYVAATSIGLLGLVWYRPLIEWAFASIGVALVPTGEAVRLVAERMPT